MSEIWSKEEEVRRLQERFDALKAKKISQASFAREHNMPGGASMITQHLKATRPISMEHALVYARGFGCAISEISPRLAKLVEAGQATLSDRDFVIKNGDGTVSIVEVKAPASQNNFVSSLGSQLAELFELLPDDPMLRIAVFTECNQTILRAVQNIGGAPSHTQGERIHQETQVE